MTVRLCLSAARSLYRRFSGLCAVSIALFGCLLSGGIDSAFAQASDTERRDAIIERSWLSDDDGSLTPDAALARAWTVYEGPLARGFTTTVTWVRLKIDPALAGAGSVSSDYRLVLRIVPSRLDDITVFRMDRPADPPKRVGDKIRLEGPQKGFLNHSVVFDDAVAPFEVLLRLQTHGNHSMHVQALRWDEANRLLSRDSNLVVGYLVFTLMVIAWAIIAYFQQHSMVLLLFIVHQFSALLAAITFLGVWRMYAPSELALLGNVLTTYVIPLSTLASQLFHGRLLADLGAKANHYRVLVGAAVLPACGIVLIAFGFVQTGLMITHATILVFMIFAIYVAARLNLDTSQNGRRHRVFVVSAYVVMVALMAPQSLRVLGVFSAGAWSFAAYTVYGIASAVLMTGLLILRAREVDRLRQRDARAFQEAKQESELQRARALEQGDLITMLTHELKTPLSVVALALGKSGTQPAIQERALYAIEDIRRIIDRCALTARVDEEVAYRSIPFEVEAIRLEQLVTVALSSRPQSARVQNEVSGDLPECATDRTMLLTIVTNLIDNALNYSPADSRVQIEAQTASVDGRLGIMLKVTNQVGDHGVPDSRHVFEKYYRGARARHRSGSGLGLYLSKRLAKRLGGDLSLHPVETSSVCFQLWLPLVAHPQVTSLAR